MEEKIINLWIKIHNLLDQNGITRAYQIIIDKYFEDLLQMSYLELLKKEIEEKK